MPVFIKELLASQSVLLNFGTLKIKDRIDGAARATQQPFRINDETVITQTAPAEYSSGKFQRLPLG
jgi:hypothetical protein